MRVRRPNLERIGTWVFVVVVVGIGLAVAASLLMNAAADDVRVRIDLASNQSPDGPRTPWGMWLAGRVTTDLAPTDTQALRIRADDLDHRADRIRELAGAVSLAGLILILATARPEARVASSQSASSPVASTRSNGTV